ncbi:hypothetical protein P692DRAFT_201808843 [Suillus brevipes Sb2]|nr:hypothetical protein P692DRAFT_201808843 [Suillus brevipes Sb2]
MFPPPKDAVTKPTSSWPDFKARIVARLRATGRTTAFCSCSLDRRILPEGQFEARRPKILPRDWSVWPEKYETFPVLAVRYYGPHHNLRLEDAHGERAKMYMGPNFIVRARSPMMRVNPRWSDKWTDITQTQAQAKKSINIKADISSNLSYTH